jgi:hypothetical protein
LDDRLVEIKKELEYLRKDTGFRSSFSKLQSLMHEIAQIKGWWEPGKSFGEQIVMMHSELSEVIEAYREEDGDTTSIWLKNFTSKPEGVPIELADLSIREFDTCEYYGIDLLDAILMKALYNLQRPQRHGGKKI